MMQFDPIPTLTFVLTLGAFAGYTAYKCVQLKTKVDQQTLRIRTLLADKIALESKILDSKDDI